MTKKHKQCGRFEDFTDGKRNSARQKRRILKKGGATLRVVAAEKNSEERPAANFTAGSEKVQQKERRANVYDTLNRTLNR